MPIEEERTIDEKTIYLFIIIVVINNMTATIKFQNMKDFFIIY